MKKQYWFKRRRYGYGWFPVTREGWSVVIAYLVAVFVTSFLLLKDVPQNTYQAEVGYFLVLIAIYSVVAVVLSYKHGPKPKWRWGKKESDNPEEDF